VRTPLSAFYEIDSLLLHIVKSGTRFSELCGGWDSRTSLPVLFLPSRCLHRKELVQEELSFSVLDHVSMVSATLVCSARISACTPDCMGRGKEPRDGAMRPLVQEQRAVAGRNEALEREKHEEQPGSS